MENEGRLTEEAGATQMSGELDDLKSANALLRGLISNRDTEIERLRAELALYKQNYARKQLTDSDGGCN